MEPKPWTGGWRSRPHVGWGHVRPPPSFSPARAGARALHHSALSTTPLHHGAPPPPPDASPCPRACLTSHCQCRPGPARPQPAAFDAGVKHQYS